MTDATPPPVPDPNNPTAAAPAAPVPPAAPLPPAAPTPYGQPQPYAAQPQPYAAQPQAYAPQYAGGYAPPTNTVAIVALILGFVFPIGGIIAGHIALGQIKRTGEGGHGLALAGTVLGYVFTGFLVLYIIGVIIAIAVSAAATSYPY